MEEDIPMSMNETVIMWIAISVAVLFVAAVVFDAIRRKRNRSRMSSARSSARQETNLSLLERVRAFFRSFDKEVERRHRLSERNRNRD